MNQDPSIDDGMTANPYVRCSGCGGYLPMGAICGYCLQRQQMAGQAIRPQPSRPKPWRTAVLLTLCVLVVGGVGLASAFLIRGAGRIAKLTGVSAPSQGSQLSDPGVAAGYGSLSSDSNRQLVSALGSGDSQQALSDLQASGASNPPVMQSNENARTPVMQTTPPPTGSSLDAGSTMPDDVRKWLEHLQRTEQARIALASGQLQDAIRTLTGLQAGDIGHALDDGGDDSQSAEKARQNERAQRVGGGMATMQQAWRTLLSSFDAVRAPAECVGIKANYDQVVGQTGSMILDIVSQIRNASNDPQGALAALTAMQGTSKAKIDVPARAADGGVSDVCRRYGVAKWFDIQSDVGSGAMSQLGF